LGRQVKYEVGSRLGNHAVHGFGRSDVTHNMPKPIGQGELEE
jgi:hypothetical protein